MAERNELHKRNRHNGQYDFSRLTEEYPPLKKFIVLNAYGTTSIDFFNPRAVKALNKALLISYYTGIFPRIICAHPFPGELIISIT
jgi:23S rRNA (adenine1618-N6)-methyltransferase